jgi:hypothetical protein
MDDVESAAAHPVRIEVGDDLVRSRLTVFFRLLLAIPHFVWLLLWTIAAFFAAIANWFATLVTAVPPRSLHRFLSAYVRYATHVFAFVLLTANPFPAFVGERGSYPVDLDFPPPERQNRWTVFFRVILALPAALIGSALFSPGGNSGDSASGAAFLGWFASLARGRMPEGFRDLQAYALRYNAQLSAYTLLLTDRYPDSNPELERREPAIAHPITLEVDDDLRRSRLTVFFRLLLAIPHLVWLSLWGSVIWFTLIVAWFAALFTAFVPDALHRFHAAYVRYQAHVWAYLALIANPFPGFVGERGYGVDALTPPQERQNRWTVGFRLLLAIPAWLVLFGLFGLLFVIAVLGWFASLALGRMPLGMRNAGAYALRYMTQVSGYSYLLTDRYPFSGPPA